MNGHGKDDDASDPAGDASAQAEQTSTTKFLLVGLLRFLGTAVLAVLFYIIIRQYQGRTLTSGDKSIFDTLVVAVSLTLGLNSAASLRHIALFARGWYAETRRVHVKEFRRVGWAAHPHASSASEVGVRNMAVTEPLGISAVSLTFKAEPGIEEIYPDSTLGNVTIPDMSRFARVGRFNDGARPQSLAAHILGDTAASYEFAPFPSGVMTDAPIARFPQAYWDAGDHWEFVFANSAPVPGSASQDLNFLSLYSNQHVESSGTCKTPRYTFNLTEGILTVKHTDEQKTILFPASGVGDEAITYLTEPVLHDARAGPNITGTCGPGCATVYVVEPHAGNPVPGSTFSNPNSSFFYYECNIAVKPTTDPNAGPFKFAPMTAAVAAQAIALSGQRAPAAANGSASRAGLNQFTSYNLGLDFGQAQNNNVTSMAKMLSRFAIGVVAAAARSNPRVTVQGHTPRQGVRLVLEKPVVFGAILIATAAVQLVLMGVVLILVRVLRKSGRGDTGSRGEVKYVTI
ncbi:uncharacterized protein C8A04DRAFT_13395 [Dichotomopilus funicola]|uniref:Uncharacterized protein n=1 Tax=Dichotomopilus funicola TaxID=1934379 RepID=A0AAN6UZS5_9PEZI|nr:hypothetical protein C8A04DRAFT_13395 [Dichotomopilus funicola]